MISWIVPLKPKPASRRPGVTSLARHLIVVATITATVVVGLKMPPASATSSVYWHDDGITLSTGSNANVVGFWQQLLGAKWCLTLDGLFGANTRNLTEDWQAQIAGVPQDGVVGTNTWSHTQFALTPPPASYYRLSGIGGGYWSYYNGNGVSTMYWEPLNPYLGDHWIWAADPATPANWYNSLPNVNNISAVSSAAC